tara:strand:- start:6392 stop:6634 length:243 start_codon:yes stop_codon:yes gene_type:complete
MFQWHYFIIYIFLGFACGYSNPNVPNNRFKPLNKFFWLIVAVTTLAVLVNLYNFGFFWGFLSSVEVGIGYFLGRKLSIGN